MTDPAYGRSGQTQEAQCYNCGSLGHWAVACPEPTRETPAGFAAWRNSYGNNQGPGKNTGHGSTSKRSKGPIITKYTPPPPPPPQLSYGAGMPPYPPPPPGAHPPGLYPGPGRSYQPYSTPPPSFAAPGFPQPAYPYHASQYSPPAPYAPPPYGQLGPLGPPPPLPPSTPFTSSRHGAHDHRLPPPPYNQSYHAPAPPRPGPGRHSPSGPSPARTQQSPPRPASITSKPPITRVSHPLPPKPPPSLDQMKPQRDNRSNRRRNDHQQSQDRRSKYFKPDQPQPSQRSPQRIYESRSPRGRPASGTSPSETRSHSHEAKTAQRQDVHVDSSSPSRLPRGTAVPISTETRASDEPEVAAEDLARDRSVSSSVKPDTDSRDSKLAHIHKHNRARSLSPPIKDASSGPSKSPEFITAKASESPKPSDDQEDGEISSNEGQGSPIRRHQSEANDKSRSPTPDGWRRRKRSFDDDSDDSNEPKYKMTKSSRLLESRDRASQGDEVNGNIWDSIDVPRQAERKRRGSTASKDSRHSSVSSKSSDLNSLEAELLGRPTKQKQVEASPSSKGRPERRGPSKPKRRQANTNSAYSRRW